MERHGLFGYVDVLHVAGHIQVEKTVAVVIRPAHARPEPRPAAEARLPGPLPKGAVASVVVENVFTVGRHDEVQPAVVIVVPPGRRHPPAAVVNARSMTDLSEGAVLVVVVERRMCRRSGDLRRGECQRPG